MPRTVVRLVQVLVFLAVLSVPAAAQGTIVYLVRHAEKASATERDPSLSSEGAERATALAAAMKDTRLDAIFVTQLKRTAETAAPVAAARSLTPTVVSVGANTDEHVAAAVAAINAHKGKAVLVVGHSNTVTAIIAGLGGPKMPSLCDASYATLFTLTIPPTGTPTLSRATYGRPDNADKATCGELTTR